MKTKLFASVLLIAFVSSAIIYGCKKKKEEETPAGFTNADYAGTWSVTDACCGGSNTFQITIAASGTNGVTIGDFRKCGQGGGWTITGTVSGNTLTIPAQNVTCTAQGGPYKFSGTGTLNSTSSLSIPYVMATASGGSPQNCTATCTK